MARERARSLAEVEGREVAYTPPVPDQKRLLIETNNHGHVYARWEGGGELPDALKGTYTSRVRLQSLVDSYMAERNAVPVGA